MAHEYLSTVPFELADLHLFHLLAETLNFTRAAQRAGLTQSALTRRIRTMEAKLGTPLFERTTRRVRLTLAGSYLLQGSGRVIGEVGALLRQVRDLYAEARREVRVGVSRSISLAHLPGLFAAHQRRHPAVLTRVTHDSSDLLLEALSHRKIDFAILCAPTRVPRDLTITHRFADAFVLIASRQIALPSVRFTTQAYRQWLMSQRWLMLHAQAQTGRLTRSWLQSQGLAVEAAMELDSFDVIIHLVALGMGVALVPQRALAAFPRRRSVQRLPWKDRFSRDIVLLSRRDRTQPRHLTEFVDALLF